MSPSPQLAAPGSSSYSSNTLNVGDGTWDSGRNDFLLPNLVGLNFETMRYNGMGNRFKNLPYYHKIIAAHGVIAVITFLFMIPAAIFIARFYHQNGRRALRLHIWIQILVVFTATVVLVLGWFAVGPGRALTNPHHGIGVALYVMIMFQFLFGSLVHHIEKGKTRYKIPLKLVLHQWLGRTIALLGIVQVALGLTVYGSPKYLFILYAVWVFILVMVYFILTYMNQHRISVDDDYGSYYTGTRTDITGSPSRGRKSSGKFGKIAAGLGGAGLLAAFANRRKSRSRSRSRSRTRTDVQSSRRTSESYIDDKYTDDGRSPKKHTWRDRLLAGAAGVGLATAARRVFSGGRKSDSSSSVSDYPHHPLGGSTTITQTDISQVEEGRVPTTPNRRTEAVGLAAVPAAMTSPSRHSRPGSRPSRRPSGTSIDSYDSRSDYYSPGKAKRETHTLRNGIAALGVAGYLRHKFKKNKDAKDDRRVEEMRRKERENERINRHASGSQRPPRYTGDGAPSRVRPGRHGSITESEMTPLHGSNPELSLHSLPPASGGRTDITTSNTLANSGLPPPPPMPGAILHNDSSNSSFGRARHSSRNRHGRGEAAAAGLAAGAAGASLAASHRNSSQRRSEGGASVNSPPVSVKVKMHNDGRHVTLRRLDPAEAAAEREARRRQGKGRSGSISSVGGGTSGDEHWRRVERMEAEQAAQQHNIPPIPANLPGPPPGPPPPPSASSFAGPSTYAGPASTMDLGDLPPPPPIPGAAESGMGGGSPGSIYGSGPSAVDSRAESNRKRRRAERARALQARQEGRGNKVNFT